MWKRRNFQMPFQIIRNDITNAEGADKMFLFANINKKLEEYRNTPGAVLVDVREVDEFRSGHIPGAINQPLSTISQIKIPKDKTLFVYCLRGSRSRRAVGILKRMGYSAKSIGGITAYKGEIER